MKKSGLLFVVFAPDLRVYPGSVIVLFYMGSDKHSSTVMQPEDPVRQDMQFYYVGDHTWATMLGQSLRLQPVPIQSLSELERARLQEVALYHLEKRDLDFKIGIPREIRKRRKSLRRKFDSFSKEKKERENASKAFGIPLTQVIANDRAHKQRQDALKESRRDCLDLEASVLRFRAEKWQHNGNRQLCNTVLTPGAASSPAVEGHSKSLSSAFMDNTSRTHRRGGLSVDSISDLVESQSRLLEALQLSHPNELELKKTSAGLTQAKLSLNPIYRQVPRVVERCCNHIQTYGLQTLGIFRVGSSKKRVRQLREDFDSGIDVMLDEEHSVHDVAALLKEFLRDMPDPLLPRELYRAFLHVNLLRGADQLTYLQQLLYLLPPCNCDTLLRLLTLLHTVQENAQNSTGPNKEEISGNKMTAANLAVIFGPNLLQKERGSERELSPQALGIEDSTAVISVTLLLIQNHKRLFTVSAELQQEVLMSLIQTDPDVIDYLLRRKVSSSGCPIMETESDGRRDTQVSLDSVSQSSDDFLFPETSAIGSLSSEVFLNALHLNTNRKRSPEAPAKSIGQIRQFHSHHNLLSLAQPSLNAQSDNTEFQESRHGGSRQTWSEERLHFSLVRQDSGSQPQSPREKGIWVRQNSNASSTTSDDSKPSNFWDFFTGKIPVVRSPSLQNFFNNQSQCEKK
ncbi:rho GTPase-activating protein 6-like isoform X3 [Myxocyprinus asiaticus]|uniref:rho GTPase-activating protein 6-like isoform X3 n=1 Tax=Myxocyprinus asiaticus TaxID=70543 RepID=UPI002222560E|nr:rho GTPase-activating protein 6-like isoform X3 [Myxocyprinus asiaticus]